MTEIETDLERVAALLAPVAQIIEQRVEAPEPPSWAESRGWSAYLLGLDPHLAETKYKPSRSEEEP